MGMGVVPAPSNNRNRSSLNLQRDLKSQSTSEITTQSSLGLLRMNDSNRCELKSLAGWI